MPTIKSFASTSNLHSFGTNPLLNYNTTTTSLRNQINQQYKTGGEDTNISVANNNNQTFCHGTTKDFQSINFPDKVSETAVSPVI